MELARIQSAISTCESHIHELDDGELKSIEIENGLVSYLVVTIVAEYEQVIQELFCLRADICGDRHVSNYVRSQMAGRFRTPDLGKINETLGCFGKDYRAPFEQATLNTPAHASWDNVVRARHTVVHKAGTFNITFRELKAAYGDTKTILAALVEALGLSKRLSLEWQHELVQAGIDLEKTNQQPVGTVTHFFQKLHVAAVRMESGEIKVGDHIRVQGHTTDFSQPIVSMEKDRKQIGSAGAGEEVGIQVSERVRPGDKVFILPVGKT